MRSKCEIRSIAVIGNGTMGCQLSSFFSELGFNVLVISRQNEDFSSIKNIDWVIETIAEDETSKVDLLKKISPYLNQNQIISSNTSGIPITKLSKALPEYLQNIFFGTHFFNPVRKLKLVEMIATQYTDLNLFSQMKDWLTFNLDRVAIESKDSPCFLATRLGAFVRVSAFHLMNKYKLDFESVDYLTGPCMGRPKSGTFGTMDLIGLDVISKNLERIYDSFESDPFRDYFLEPIWMKKLRSLNFLGNKTKKTGCYRFENNLKYYFHPEKLEYQLANKISENQNHIRFIQDHINDVYGYANYLLGQDRIKTDQILKYAHGWKHGIFELHDQLQEVIKYEVKVASSLFL